jgi:hypothetical protein
MRLRPSTSASAGSACRRGRRGDGTAWKGISYGSSSCPGAPGGPGRPHPRRQSRRRRWLPAAGHARPRPSRGHRSAHLWPGWPSVHSVARIGPRGAVHTTAIVRPRPAAAAGRNRRLRERGTTMTPAPRIRSAPRRADAAVAGPGAPCRRGAARARRAPGAVPARWDAGAAGRPGESEASCEFGPNDATTHHVKRGIMSQIVAIHSSRDGMGKSNLSAHVASLMALEGKGVGIVCTKMQSSRMY